MANDHYIIAIVPVASSLDASKVWHLSGGSDAYATQEFGTLLCPASGSAFATETHRLLGAWFDSDFATVALNLPNGVLPDISPADWSDLGLTEQQANDAAVTLQVFVGTGQDLEPSTVLNAAMSATGLRPKQFDV
jgi:hypothetical protein